MADIGVAHGIGAIRNHGDFLTRYHPLQMLLDARMIRDQMLAKPTAGNLVQIEPRLRGNTPFLPFPLNAVHIDQIWHAT